MVDPKRIVPNGERAAVTAVLIIAGRRVSVPVIN
jgi:hypothetical protein